MPKLTGNETPFVRLNCPHNSESLYIGPNTFSPSQINKLTKPWDSHTINNQIYYTLQSVNPIEKI